MIIQTGYIGKGMCWKHGGQETLQEKELGNAQRCMKCLEGVTTVIGLIQMGISSIIISARRY